MVEDNDEHPKTHDESVEEDLWIRGAERARTSYWSSLTPSERRRLVRIDPEWLRSALAQAALPTTIADQVEVRQPPNIADHWSSEENRWRSESGVVDPWLVLMFAASVAASVTGVPRAMAFSKLVHAAFGQGAADLLAEALDDS